jgi:ribosomal protein L7/L12
MKVNKKIKKKIAEIYLSDYLGSKGRIGCIRYLREIFECNLAEAIDVFNSMGIIKNEDAEQYLESLKKKT